MRERQIKALIAKRLKDEGFSFPDVRYGSQRGIDIETRHPDTNTPIYMEIKGERTGGNESAMARAAVGESLFQILSVYDGLALCVLVFPKTQRFINLVNRVRTPLSKLKIHILFVEEVGIWHLSPDSIMPYPQKIETLREVLKNG